MRPRITIRLLAVLLLFLLTNNTIVLAHGGEDAGDQPAPATASDKGTVTRTAKVDDIELTLKHPVLVPDTASSGKLFLTEFQTNAPVEGASAALEFEGAGGSVTQAMVEKTDTPGVFSVKIPPLPEGSYTARVKLTAKNETDTATFSGINVAHPESAVTTSAFGWMRTLLAATLFLAVGCLFVILAYMALRRPSGRRFTEEAVSV